MKSKRVVKTFSFLLLGIFCMSITVNAQGINNSEILELEEKDNLAVEWGYLVEVEDDKNIKEITALSDTGKWIQSLDGRWWYQHSDGTYTKNGWEYINGSWYRFDADGWMMTGWYFENGHWYYLKSNGAMAVGWVKVGEYWYYCNASGIMQTGWLDLNGIRYYLNKSGAMETGWTEIDGKYYYFSSNGAQVSEKQKNVKDGWTMTFAVPEGGWSVATVELYYSEHYVKVSDYGHFVEHEECTMYNCSGATVTPVVYMNILKYSNGIEVYPWKVGELIYDGSKWNGATLLRNNNKYSFVADTQITGSVTGTVYCQGAIVPTRAISVSQRLNVQ